MHSTKDARLDRRPWISGERETKAMRRMYHLRSELMPYIYSSVWQTHNTMVPLNRSMFIDYGSQKESFSQPQQFTFGDILLAAPITSPGEGPDKIASQKVWFPDGEVWYDFFTHEKQQGDATRQIAKSLDEFPLYVRGGWILPMQPYTPRPATEPLRELVMRVYPAASDADNSFELYEDDGLTLEYLDGRYATTQLRYTQTGNKACVTIEPTAGTYNGQLKSRAYTLQLPAAAPGTQVKVNGKKAKTVTDAATGITTVKVKSAPVQRRTTIEYEL